MMGIGDGLRVLRSVFLAAVGSVFASVPLFGTLPHVTYSFLNFFILLSLIMASRFSYSTLTGKKPALIYGADAFGLVALQLILDSDQYDITPVGFLDDDPAMEGKSLNGYPVFGNHSKLDRVAQEVGVQVIILPHGGVRSQDLLRLQRISRKLGLEMRRLEITLEPVPGDGEHTRALLNRVHPVEAGR
jgi:FlaA1/EpsC-like NDP-sugar epimerase